MVQRRAARFVTKTYDRQTSITKVVKDLGWNTLEQRRKATRLTIIHKARQGLFALPVNPLLQPVLRQSRHNHPAAYQIIACNKKCYQLSFLPRTVIDWNKLEFSTIQIQDPDVFKDTVLKDLQQGPKKVSEASTQQ